MLSLRIFFAVALLQIFAAATPIAPRQIVPISPPVGDPTGLLNFPIGGDAGIYTEIEGEPISTMGQEFENEDDFEKA